MAKTPTGKSVQKYITDVLGTSTDAGKAAIAAGYPDQSSYTQAYLAGVPYLSQYGDAQQAEALARMGNLYDQYGAAGGYNKTDFADLGSQYSAAGQYAPTAYSDIEGLYGLASQYGPTAYGDIEGLYGAAGQYTPTTYGDIGGLYSAAGEYNPTTYADLEAQYSGIAAYDPTQYGDIAARYESSLGYGPAQFGASDYTTQNIQNRMTPYEELVSQRAAARLKKGYDEGRSEREIQAARQGAFGGSGAAIQEEVARRNYLEQMDEMNANNLQAAYESGAGLYGREMAENLAAGQAQESSRQFGQNAEMAGLAGLMSTRNAEQQAIDFQKKLELDVMSGKITSRQAEEASREFANQAKFASASGQESARQAAEASRQFANQAQFAGAAGQTTARQAAEASRQFGSQAQFSGLEGQMAARQQTAAQEAAAKEAQFAGLQGQGTSAQQQATLAEQKKNMQISNLAAMQQAGQQQQREQLAKQEYPLEIAAQQSNIISPITGAGAIQTKANKPSTAQNILGGLTAAAGVAEGIGGLFRSGGYVYRGGGLADLDLQARRLCKHSHHRGTGRLCPLQRQRLP